MVSCTSTHIITNSKSTVHKLRDFISTGPNLDLYEDGEFTILIMDINAVLHSIGYVNINLYHDASGTLYIKDSNGNDISNRRIAETMYTYPYVNNVTNEPISGSLYLKFDDNSDIILTNYDTHTLVNNDFDYWYYIEGIIPVVIKPFT